MREVLVKGEEFKDSPLGKIPKNWEISTIGEKAFISSGTTPSRSLATYWQNGTISWVKTGEINYTVIQNTEEKVTQKALNETSLTLYPVGTVLVAMYGQGLTRGKVGILGIEATTNQACAAIIPKDENLIPSYLFHYLSYHYQDIRSISHGSNQSNLSESLIASFRIRLPPREEQKKIAEILDTVDDAIARTSSLITKLKQIKAGLLHDLLTRGLGEDGHLRDLETHPEVFKDSPLGRIPKDWDVMPIQKAASQVPGSTVIGPFGSNLLADDYRSTGVPVVFVRDIKVNGFQWNSYIYVEYRKARQLLAHSVLPGDLLATKMGLPPCIASVYPEWMPPGIITADIIRLRPDTPIATSEWLSMFINSDAVIRQVRGITGGVTRDKVTLQDFRKLLIALPNLKEQKLITNILDIHDTRIRKEEAYLNKLKLQKQGLMHDLLTGKVRVNDMK